MKYLNRILVASLLLFFAISVDSFSEGKKDTRGKEFWLTFIPNYHNKITDSNRQERYADSLTIYISATEPCSGVIEYYNYRGDFLEQFFTITNPRDIYSFSVRSYDYELYGYGEKSRPTNRNTDNEIVSKKSFHIVSDEDVIVQGLSHAQYSSEGFLVLPITALSRKYYVLSYNNNWYNYRTPSQFAVVAVEDDTEIELLLNAESQQGRTSTTVTLNKGETYLVQSKVDNDHKFSDFTGSEVFSNKPVAVFSGHQRAGIPYDNTDGLSSDMLVEQMIPIELYGTRYCIVPFNKGDNEDDTGTDIFRLIAAYDNTEVLINGSLITTIDKGEFYEGPLTEAFFLKTSRPTLVGLYRKSTSASMGGSYSNSDPFFLIIPPIEKYVNEVRIESIRAFSYLGGDLVQVYSDHYVNIIYNPQTTASIIFDGSEIISTPAIDVPNSTYKYFIKKVSQGIHEITSDGDIGMIAYGYGAADSYGFLAGIKNTIFDYKPPVIYSNIVCDTLFGSITDSTEHDTRITEVNVPMNQNTDVKIIDFRKFAKVINFEASLIDKYQDGSFRIVALDSFEIETKESFEIPGFTVSVPSFEISGMEELEGQMPMNRTFCTDVEIHNYGKFTQTINEIMIKNRPDLFVVSPNSNITLNPGENITVQVCYSPEQQGEFKDTLIIDNDCYDRQIAVLTITTWTDEVDPKVTLELNECQTVADVVVTDTTEFDFGLEIVEIIEQTNLSYTSNENYPDYVEFHFTVVDPYYDAIYEIYAKDTVGHELTIRDTLQGFTLEIAELEGNDSTNTFDKIPIGTLHCQTIVLYNYGLKQLVLDRIYLDENIEFSIPLSQLPIVIEPGDSSEVEICFRSIESDVAYNDLISILFNCLNADINLEGTATSLELETITNCNVPVRVVATKIPKNASLEQNIPNPAVSTTSILFGIPNDGNVSINLYTIDGYLEKNILNTKFPKGLFEIDLETSDLRPGVYIYVMRTNDTVLSRKIIIDK